jgi:hypothetical protein
MRHVMVRIMIDIVHFSKISKADWGSRPYRRQRKEYFPGQRPRRGDNMSSTIGNPSQIDDICCRNDSHIHRIPKIGSAAIRYSIILELDPD